MFRLFSEQPLRCLAPVLLALALAFAGHVHAQESDLARQTQNPVADLISLPFQNNTLFDIGPDDDTANVLNIQPVIPFHVGDWNVISRTIAPLIYLPEIDLLAGTPEVPEGAEATSDSEFGLGDINQTLFFSPANSGPLIWGIGPSISVPTATDNKLGSEKWSAGPSVVGLTMQGPWVVGGLVRQLWSFAGEDDRNNVNQLLIQPFINYNFAGGWYASSAPIITANWDADSDDRWTVPVGGGFGRVMAIGKQPINLSLQTFYNVETPEFGPDWSTRLTLQLLFPK